MSAGKVHSRKYLPLEISSAEMQAIEDNAEKMGLSRRLMMENAGAGTADFIASKTNVIGKRILAVCGTGNNGGDGFVTVRHLRNLGAKIKVVLIGNPSEIRTEEARANWSLIEQMENIEKFYIIDDSQIIRFIKELNQSDLIIDAILGTGVKGKLREPILSVVNEINKANKLIFAVDTPTGLDPSTGEIHGLAVKAKYTITFHKMKKGFGFRKEYVGDVFVREIGIPVEAEFFITFESTSGANK